MTTVTSRQKTFAWTRQPMSARSRPIGPGELNPPIPQRPNPGTTHAQTGLEIRSGILSFRIVGLDQTEYAISCLFLGDPATPPDPTQPATLPRKLLQPIQLLEWLRWTIQKDPATGSLDGDLVVEKK